jgi:hypothetical protein
MTAESGLVLRVEFQLRYNNRSGLGVSDGERAAIALKGIEGKRLTCRRTGEAAQ